MNPVAQRIAIAKACGWKIKYTTTNVGVPFGTDPSDGLQDHVPDYLNDLNAMHEAEEILDDNQWEYYWYQLHRITPGRPTCVCHAKAALRAEAFLKTLSLWKP